MPEYTLFNPTIQIPTTVRNFPGQEIIVGRTFSSSVPGRIVALRYFRDTGDTASPHIGRLWDKSTQTELLNVTYQNETASGWQEQRLSTPYPIQSNTAYVVSVNVATRTISSTLMSAEFVNGFLSSVTRLGSVRTSSVGFPLDSTQYGLLNVDIEFVPAFNGSITIVGVPSAGQILTGSVQDINQINFNNIAYQWQLSNNNGATWANISGANASSYLISKSLTNQRLRLLASYTDEEGFSESLTSAATSTITNTNDVGLISITGAAVENEILTAVITDTDGLIGVSISYQWQSSTNGTNWSNISGATSSTLLLTNNLVNRTIRVLASYTDQLGANETLTSLATSSVVNVNNAGSVLLAGIPLQGQTLTALIVDDDGVPGAGVTYQWQSTDNDGVSWQSISGATSNTFLITESYVGTKLRVLASYTDSYGTTDSVISVSTNTILDVNDIGSVSIAYVVNVNGSPVQGATLTAIVTDPDGINNASITYQWLVSGCPVSCNYIDEETSSTLILTNSFVGKRIRVLASYLDDNGNNELIISNPTPIVVNLNDLGSVSILGTAIQGHTLTALAEDLDGLVNITISYQWQSTSNNGVSWQNIAGTTDSTLILTNSLVGKKIRVNAVYTDNYGTAENLFSDPTIIVANLNDSGSISIVGTVAQGQTLTTQIMDYDGLNSATINYQWESSSNYGVSWQNITGATDSALILTNSLVGKIVRVVADYIDDHGSEETVVSDPTIPVANINDTGSITVSGTNLQGEILSTLIEDIDGISNIPIDYQWQSSSNNGISWQDVDNATDSFLILTSSLVGKIIRVTASYIDIRGTQENLISDPTTVIANLNDLGSITIGGVPAQGQILVAVVEDVDGVSAINYAWQSSGNNGATWQNIAGATTSSIALSSSLVGNLVRVTASYTDSLGTQENLISDPTNAIANLNDTGLVIVNGVLTQGQTLTALVEDVDGVEGTINYVWQSSSNNGVSWQNIQSQPVATLLLTEALIGKSIRVIATYTDNYGNNEIVVSSTTNTVANLNDSGVISISGNPSRGELLTALVEDVDGLHAVNINYQWQSSENNGTSWQNITGATSQAFLLTSSDIGKIIRVVATYTDSRGTNETIVSSPTSTISFINTPGIVTITGVPLQGQILTAIVEDTDRLNGATISYQWKSSGNNGISWENIPEANTSTLLLDETLIDKSIKVTVTYNDDLGTLEVITSLAINTVLPLIVPATLSIQGTLLLGETVTALIQNADNITTVTYQWLFNSNELGWQEIQGITSNTLTLTKSLVGKRLRAIADYIDEAGDLKSILSLPTSPVENINAPGTITISGSLFAGQTLTALVEDDDGLTTSEITYQWQVSQDSGNSWQDIPEEVSEELTLSSNLVGKKVRCIADYVDDFGSQENPISAASADILPAPEVGDVSISGIPRQYNELTAVITDANGVKSNSESYQWQKSIDSFDWENISGATTSTLYLSVNLITYYVRANVTYTTEVDTPVNIFSQPTDQVYSSLQKTDYLRMLNPLALVSSPNTTFTFRSEQQWVIDEETGNFIPGDTDNVVLVTATLKQQKDPNLVVQPGVDYNRIYFEGYLLTPKVKIDAEQGRNVPTILNGRQGLFDFVPVMESVEEINLSQRQVNGQMIAGYFRFS